TRHSRGNVTLPLPMVPWSDGLSLYKLTYCVYESGSRNGHKDNLRCKQVPTKLHLLSCQGHQQGNHKHQASYMHSLPLDVATLCRDRAQFRLRLKLVGGNLIEQCCSSQCPIPEQMCIRTRPVDESVKGKELLASVPLEVAITDRLKVLA